MELYMEPSIPTIQAALLLSFITVSNSLDAIGTAYLEHAIQMGELLRLFAPIDSMDDLEMSRARIFTAWRIFSWQALFNYYFFRPPHMHNPPQVPLPATGSDEQWYGEIWLRYPPKQGMAGRTLIPLHLGHQMQAEAGLYTIMNELGHLSFEKPYSRPLTFEEIDALKCRLDAWKDALPGPLQAKALVLPQHFSL